MRDARHIFLWRWEGPAKIWAKVSDNPETVAKFASKQQSLGFPGEDLLVDAIQAANLGRFDSARAFLSVRAAGDGFYLFTGEPQAQPLTVRVARLAFDRTALEVSVPSADWPAIARRLDIVAISGFLPESCIEERRFLKGLHDAMRPPESPSWSIERLVDDLIGCKLLCGQLFVGRDDRYERFRNLGYAAIPIAIKHLGDFRLTHAHYLGGGASGQRVITIDDLMFNFLADATDGELAYGPRPLTREAAEKWWARERDKSEEEFWVSHVFATHGGLPISPWFVVDQIARKFPERLQGLFHKSLEEPNWAVPYLAQAVAKMDAPKDRKVAVLLEGASSLDLLHRADSLKALREVDAVVFRSELIRSIKSIPVTCKQDERFGVSGLAALVQPDDPEVWDAYIRRLPDLEPRLRLALLETSLTFLRHPPKVIYRGLLDLVRRREVAYSPYIVGMPEKRFDLYVGARIGVYLDRALDARPPMTPDDWDAFGSRVEAKLRRLAA